MICKCVVVLCLILCTISQECPRLTEIDIIRIAKFTSHVAYAKREDMVLFYNGAYSNIPGLLPNVIIEKYYTSGPITVKWHPNVHQVILDEMEMQAPLSLSTIVTTLLHHDVWFSVSTEGYKEERESWSEEEKRCKTQASILVNLAPGSGITQITL